MKAKISRSDFTFLPDGSGAYKVTYKSPATLMEWTARVDDMEAIDATKNADEPTQAALNSLKARVKRTAYKVTKLGKSGERVEVEA